MRQSDQKKNPGLRQRDSCEIERVETDGEDCGKGNGRHLRATDRNGVCRAWK